MSNLGFRILPDFERPDQELIELFRDLPVANIDDNMGRIACMDTAIKPFNKAKLLGCAFTVKVPQGDNLMFHKALDLAKPGDIIVVAGFGNMERSLCGEIMMHYAMARGLKGFVIDGVIRDSDTTAKLDFPVYARGVNPNGPYKNGPGEINVPVAVGGQVVFPGDILVGDDDGIVVIRPQDAVELAEKVRKTKATEEKALSDIMAWGRAWVDKALQDKGCEICE